MESTRQLDPSQEEAFFAGVRFAGEFFMATSSVHRALAKLTGILEDAEISYAVIGAMALNEFGYRRVTEDVDVLLSVEGLERLKSLHLGLGYVEKFQGSKGLRDTENGVPIDVVLAGEYPGDGKPKPVRFPDPADEALIGERIRLLPLPRFIELKLASGLTAPHRLRDLADVLELIRINGLSPDLAEDLDPMVRDKYRELWEAAQNRDAE